MGESMATTIPLIMEVITKSRKKPKAGDIFVLKIISGPYFFGRVIKTEVDAGFGGRIAYLIYIYRDSSSNADELPDLDKNRLIIPPMMINQRPWIEGYFQTISHKPILEDDQFKRHCFRNSRGVFFDEYGNALPKPVTGATIGPYGLSSYGAVSEELSKVLKVKSPY